MSEEQNNTTEQTTEEQKPNITIEDIVLAQRVISTASSRAAFKAEEMSVVGGLYDRLTRFVKYHVPEKKPEAEEAGETTAETGEATADGEAAE